MYDLIIRLFVGVLRLAAVFNVKARLWVEGRRNWRKRYRVAFRKTAPVLWVHAASLGEFEQGRPVIEAFREKFPDWQVVLTFFSPSGYEIRKNYDRADWVTYLPADTRRNARDFLELVQPDRAIFIKYEFWSNYLHELRRRGVPTLLVSALFREGQPFFRPWGGFWRRMLGCVAHFFVQNAASAALLRRLGFENVTVAGDTRVDRVLKLAAGAIENDLARAFTAGHDPVFIAGSSWPADEAVFLPVLQQPEFQHFKAIIAPHEPSPAHLQRLEKLLGADMVRYSQAQPETAGAARFLVIDNVGMLNTLYRYGTLAYIGGGFGSGIHNILEPAAYGLPVLFGPNYGKFEEARELVARGGAFVVQDSAALARTLDHLSQPRAYRTGASAVTAFLQESRGATRLIMEYLGGTLAQRP
jgi:3-deoxy-D-manno-octulosonic-acid transferase